MPKMMIQIIPIPSKIFMRRSNVSQFLHPPYFHDQRRPKITHATKAASPAIGIKEMTNHK